MFFNHPDVFDVFGCCAPRLYESTTVNNNKKEDSNETIIHIKHFLISTKDISLASTPLTYYDFESECDT